MLQKIQSPKIVANKFTNNFNDLNGAPTRTRTADLLITNALGKIVSGLITQCYSRSEKRVTRMSQGSLCEVTMPPSSPNLSARPDLVATLEISKSEHRKVWHELLIVVACWSLCVCSVESCSLLFFAIDRTVILTRAEKIISAIKRKPISTVFRRTSWPTDTTFIAKLSSFNRLCHRIESLLHLWSALVAPSPYGST